MWSINFCEFKLSMHDLLFVLTMVFTLNVCIVVSFNAIQLKWFLQDYCICLPSSYKVKSFFLCCRNIIQVIDLIWQDIQSRFYILVRQHQSWRWTGKHCINYHTRTVHRTVLQRTIEILVLICQHAVFFNKKTSTMNGKTAGINGIAE